MPKYFGIIEGNETSKYLQAKDIKITFNEKSSIENLWKKHKNIIKDIKNYKKIGNNSLLDLKIELSSRLFNNCIFCEHKCKINRIETIGKCKTKESKIASKFIHFGEEKVLIPSYTIFFSGCTFHPPPSRQMRKACLKDSLHPGQARWLWTIRQKPNCRAFPISRLHFEKA